jgi:hypothetical protein
MVNLIADLSYILAVALNLAALLLVLEWLVHFLPGAWLNFARKGFFNATFPLLKWNESFLSFEWGSFHSRGLLMAVLFVALSRYGVPWLVLLSYSLRG